jgi:hypothetical protein
MDMARAVTATFTLQQFALTVAKAGNGAGTVAGGAISCGATCMATLDFGTVVTLTATPATGSTFTGWGGACTGAGTCTVTMDMARAVTATFTLQQFALAVTKGGTGTGTVTGGPISCGATCNANVNFGTVVTLTATANAADSFFAGWGGACTGTGTCTVTMDMAQSVTATFTLNSYVLTVTKAGAGNGIILGGAINCGSACTETATHGTVITLTAMPGTGSVFTGWSGGGCTGAGSCVVTLTAATSVVATFALQQLTLTVVPAGTGAGTETGGGINCGTACSTTVSFGTVVNLLAAPSTTPATASTFNGWSGGGCTGTAGCTVTVTAATTVTATYTLKPNILFVTSTAQTGSLGGLAGADAICKNLATAANLPGSYVAYLSSISANTPINAPSRVGAASGWVRVDGKPVMNKITEFTGGALFNAPSLMENGIDVTQTQFPFVWTGTSQTGTYVNACSAAVAFIPWGGTAGSANIGLATSTTATAVNTDILNCAATQRLYCLGIDRTAVAQ